MNTTYNKITDSYEIPVGCSVTYYCRDCGKLIGTSDHTTRLCSARVPESIRCESCNKANYAKIAEQVKDIPDPMGSSASILGISE